MAGVVDGVGRVTALSLAPGNRNDLRTITALIDKLAVCWAVGDRDFDAATISLGTARSKCAALHSATPIDQNPILLGAALCDRRIVENFFARTKRIRRWSSSIMRCSALARLAMKISPSPSSAS